MEINYINFSSRPCIITGVVQQWKAFTAWRDPNYLIQKVGADTIIPLRTDFKSVEDPNYSDEWLGKTVKKTFGEFMEHWNKLRSGPHFNRLEISFWIHNINPYHHSFTQIFSCAGTQSNPSMSDYYYLASLPMNVHFPPLTEDVIPPPHAMEQNKSGNLWIGNKGNVHHLEKVKIFTPLLNSLFEIILNDRSSDSCSSRLVFW
jgi:hypothetical protein